MPHLFIISVEVLSWLLLRAEENGRIHEIQIGRNVPSLSHLMFADDMIVFCHANSDEVNHVMACIR